MIDLTALVVPLLLRPIWLQPHINATNLHSQITIRIILTYEQQQLSMLDALMVLEVPKVIVIGANLTDLPTAYYPEELSPATKSTIKLPKTSALRFQTHAENFIVFLPLAASTDCTLSMQINDDYKKGQLHSRRRFPFNNSPLRAHHLFVGERNALKCVFKLQKIQVLKYKTGIIVNVGKPISIMIEKYVEESRESIFVETEWPNFGSTYQAKFGLIRNRKLLVWSYPNRMNIYYDEHGKPSAGLTYLIVKNMAERVNCSLVYKTEGWENIGQNPNGTWNGFLGALVDNKIDIAIWVTLFYPRYPYYDIPATCLYEKFGIMTPVPRTTVKWQAIFHLLEPDVFILMGVSSLLFSLILYARYTKQTYHPNVFKIDRLYLSIIGPLSIFIQRPIVLPTRAKYIAVIFLFASIVLDICFESNLVAVLTSPDEEIVPKTAKELNDMRTYNPEYVKYEGSTAEPYLTETARTREDIKNLLSRLDRLPYQSNVDSLTCTALGKKSVTLDYQQTSLLDVAANLTVFPGIYPIKNGEVLQHLWLGPAVRKYSKLSEVVELNGRRLDQTGHNLKWVEETLELVRRRGTTWMKAEKNTFYEQLKDLASHFVNWREQPFTLEHFTFAFLCLTVGNSMAIIAYSLEAISGMK